MEAPFAGVMQGPLQRPNHLQQEPSGLPKLLGHSIWLLLLLSLLCHTSSSAASLCYPGRCNS